MREDWVTTKLDEVCLKIQDGAHRSPQKLYSESGPGRFLYITSKNIRNGYMDFDDIAYADAEFHNSIYPRCNPELGDILLTKDGANTGNVTINTVAEPFSLLSSVCLIKTNASRLLPKFLLYYIQSDAGFKHITGSMTGAAIKRIILQTIKASEIPLPPLPEQQRIVAILDDAFAGLATATANAEKNLKNARDLFESYVNSVFVNKGKDWKQQRLGDAVISVSTGPFGSLLHKSDYVDGGIPIVNPINIVEGSIVADASKTLSADTVSRLSAYKLFKNDVVVGRRGEIGRCAVVRGEQAGWLCGTGCFFIRTGEAVDAEFLSHLLRSADYSRALERVATGTTMRNLSNTALQNFMVSLPPLSEQRNLEQAFGKLAEETNRATDAYERRLVTLAVLKQSILQRAFSGELTAPPSQAIKEAAE